MRTRRDRWAFGLGAAVLLPPLLPLLLHWGRIGPGDFDQFSTFNQIALWWHALGDRSVTWDPFLCGGATLVGNPQIPLYHPNLFIYWMFGPSNGLVVSVLPWTLLGFTGMRALALHYGMRRDVAAWLGAAWALNGYFTGQLGAMHIMYTASHTLPWLFLLNERLVQSKSWAGFAVLPFALALPSLYNHHFLAYSFPFVIGHFWVALGLGPKGTRRWPKLILHLCAVVLAMGMIALFLWPSLVWNAAFPRFKPPEFEPPLNLLQMLFLPVQIVPLEVEHDMFERFYTLGPVLFMVLIQGLREQVWRQPRFRPLVVVALVAAVTAVGSLVPLGGPAALPFDLLRAWAPGYQAIRVPSRFFVNALPMLLLVVGFAGEKLTAGLSRRRRQLWVLAGLLPLWIFSLLIFELSVFGIERAQYRPQPAEAAGPFAWAPRGRRFRMMSAIEPNVGILDCYEALEVPQAEALRVDRGFVLDGPEGLEVRRSSWSAFELRTATPTTARVQLNFNHHPGWQLSASDGQARVLSSLREPFEIEILHATFVRLRFSDRSWDEGRLVTLLAALASLLFGGVLVGLDRVRA